MIENTARRFSIMIESTAIMIENTARRLAVFFYHDRKHSDAPCCGFYHNRKHSKSKSTQQFSGDGDEGDQAHFIATIAKPAGLFELEQPMATSDNPRARAKLDRVYTNHDVIDQLDHNFQCAALDWVNSLSQHRAVAFARTAENTSRWRS